MNSTVDIRNGLIYLSPYLSDDVLISLLTRAEPLNQWHLCEILLANSPLSPEVMNVYNQITPLAEYLDILLNQYQSGTNTLGLMQDNLKKEVKEKEVALKSYVQKVYKEDEIDVNAIKNIMADEKQKIRLQSEIKIANKIGNQSAAMELLNEYEEGNNEVWKQFMELLLQLDYKNNFEGISEDQIAQLEFLGSQNKIGSNDAKLIHSIVTDTPINLDFELLDENKSFQSYSEPKPTAKRKPELAGVYPNPAKGEFYITYVLPTEKDNASIDIYNMEGKLVRSEDITNGYGILQLDSRQFKPGMYLFNLQLNGETVATHKFTVVE